MKKVSVICIDCEPGFIDILLGMQTYANLEVVRAETGREFYQDIAEYCDNTDSDYICFLEPGQLIGKNKISDMVEYAEKMNAADVIFCLRNYCEEDCTLVAYPDRAYHMVFRDTFFNGSQMLCHCVEQGCNLLGNLTTTMFRREKVTLSMERLQQYEVDGEPALQKAFLLFEILAGRVMCLLEQVLVTTFVRKLDLQEFWAQDRKFTEQFQRFAELHAWELKAAPSGIAKVHRDLFQERDAQNRNLKKEITFFATDKGEYYNLLPIMREAKKRGYEVSFTDNLDAKAEIGIYCQHVGKPENAKFSVVLLHDMAQRHISWPNIWEAEFWDIYDLGILPGERWKERWERSAFQYHTCPRCGAYMLGYPKSNEAYSAELEERVEELKAAMGLKHDISVLYAPSWENDAKEDDFVQSLSSLPVNLLVKQAVFPEGFEHIVKNIQNMRKLHEGSYDNLYYIEPEESIMVALKMCDLVVSDESSVMIEGMIFGKPALAVEDWLIPDTEPSRFASIPYDEVYKCKRADLRETVEGLIAKGLEDDEISKKAEAIFVNKEYVNRDILDAIEYFTAGKEEADFMKWQMSCRYMPVNMWS